MKKFAVVIAMILISFHVCGQIINVESKRLNGTKQGWNGQIDFNLNYIKNTKEIWQFGNRIAVEYLAHKHRYLILNNIALIKAAGSDLVNKGFLHARYSYKWNLGGRFNFESFEQIQYNSVQKITVRNLTGAGFRVKVLGNDTVNLNVGVASMIEYEKLTDNTEEINFRGSNYMSFNWKINKKVTLKTIWYYQPKFSNFQDYRLSGESSASLKISNKLSFLTLFALLYDNMPPDGVPKSILSLKNGIRYKFG
ncbi:MAG: hypothetical protein ACI9J3_000577 [Parvicellaceae bacterium]|jgi:hypothetical protein